MRKFLKNSINPIKVIKDPKNIYAYSAFYFNEGIWQDVGWAVLDDSRKFIDVIWIKPKFKGLGIGTAIINFIENDIGYEIKTDYKTKEGKQFFKKIGRSSSPKLLRKNPSKTLFICHGKEHGVLPEILTLDARRVVDPDIIADITAWNFTQKHLKYKNYFDEIYLVYCPIDVYALTTENENYKISKTTSPLYQTFYNVHFLLKPNGIVSIDNFILAIFQKANWTLQDRYLFLENYNKEGTVPNKVYEIIENFMRPIEKLFGVYNVGIDLILRKK